MALAEIIKKLCKRQLRFVRMSLVAEDSHTIAATLNQQVFAAVETSPLLAVFERLHCVNKVPWCGEKTSARVHTSKWHSVGILRLGMVVVLAIFKLALRVA